MASKDYYHVLGIPWNASPRAIRTAFRALVRQHHPDRAGPEGTPAFRETLEAYRVLSDPERRRIHDADLRDRSDAQVPIHRAATARPPRPSGSRAEAIRPLDSPARPRSGPASPPSGKPERNRSARSLPVYCEVELTQSEWRRGGSLELPIPIAAPCPACRGTGRFAGFRCPRCRALGEFRFELPVALEIPPHCRPGTIAEGTIADASLPQRGMPPIHLRVRIRVSP